MMSADRIVQRAVQAAARGERHSIDGDELETVVRLVGRARGLASFGGHDATLISAARPEHRYVSFGGVATGQLREQCQYASRAISGVHGYPCLGDGLRFIGDPSDYHFVLIHEDDVEEFVRRWQAAFPR